MEKEKTKTRTQLLRVLSMAGSFLASVAAADMTGIASLIPNEWNGWLLAVGLMAASLKQFIMIVGDIIDDGKRNKSFKV